MLIPTPARQETQPAQSDYSQLLTAMRLLSGTEELERDPSRARVILERLSNSHRKDIAQDAQSMIRAAKVRHWFEDQVPHHFELERIAAESMKNKEADPRQRASVGAVIALLGLFVAGLVAYYLATGGFDDEKPWLMIWVVGLLVVAGLMAFATRLDRLH